jgi:hypothetical protein
MSKTIGWLIGELEKSKPETLVEFIPFRLVPTSVQSWRGVYSEAALGYSAGIMKTAGELLANLKSAIDGREFTGWKGGDYTYTENTPLHIDNPGNYQQGGEISKIEVKDWIVQIHVSPSDG